MNAIWIDLPADAMNVAAAFRLVLGRTAGGATLRLLGRLVVLPDSAVAPHEGLNLLAGCLHAPVLLLAHTDLTIVNVTVNFQT